MSLFLGTLKSSLRRAFLNYKFPACIVFTALLLCIGVFATKYINKNVISVIAQGGMSAASLVCICVIPVIPYGASYAQEWQDGASRYWMVRSGVENYVIAKVFAAALSGFFTLFCSIALAVSLLALQMPLSKEGIFGNAYSVFIDSGKPLLYLLCYALHLSLSAALFAVLGLWVSAYLPSAFNAIAFPIMIYIFSLRFIPILGNEVNRLWTNLVDNIYDMGTPLGSLLLKLVSVVLLCGLLGMDTVRRVGKRVEHE